MQRSTEKELISLFSQKNTGEKKVWGRERDEHYGFHPQGNMGKGLLKGPGHN